jgi:hypothetical protein
MCGRANLVTAKYYKEFSDGVTAEYSDYTNLENVRLERTPNNIKIGILEFLGHAMNIFQLQFIWLSGLSKSTMNAHLLRGVVDEYVHSAERLDVCINNFLAVVVRAKIARHDDCLRSSSLNGLRSVLCVGLLLGKVCDSDATSTLHGEHDRGRATDTRVSAGDKSSLALQPMSYVSSC